MVVIYIYFFTGDQVRRTVIQLLKMKEKFDGFCFVSFVSVVFQLPQAIKLFRVVIGHKQ